MADPEANLCEEVTRLTEELAEACQLVQGKDDELEWLRGQVQTIQADTEVRLTTAWENEQLRTELEMLRKMELLRCEHQAALDRERERSAEEQRRMADWVSDLKEGFHQEKRGWEKRVSELEMGKADVASRTT